MINKETPKPPKELIKGKVEKEKTGENPVCNRCGKAMTKTLAYYFAENFPEGGIRRVDVPYFVCPRDRMAQLNYQALNQILDREIEIITRQQRGKIEGKIEDKKAELMTKIERWFEQELLYRLQGLKK
jgi:hypothetical protein